MTTIRQPLLALLLLLATACGGPTDGGTASLATRPAPTAGQTAGPAVAADPPVVLDDTTFTETWDCGYLFAASDAEQTVGIILHADQALAAEDDLPGGTIQLGTDQTAWTGEIRLGQDLFANWCDDVEEPGEPTPRISESWPITAGSLSTNCLVDDGVSDCIPSGRLTDGVAQRPDGQAAPVGPVALHNSCWGCVAG